MAVLYIGVIVALALLVLERHLKIRDLEIDLREWLADTLVVAAVADNSVSVHYLAFSAKIESILRKHFNAVRQKPLH